MAAQSDPNIKAILKEAEMADVDIVEGLRKDPALRMQLGEYLSKKIDDPNVIMAMPERVLRNTEKSAPPGYEKLGKLSSREYTVLLALSMLDGTFDEKSADTETYDFNKQARSGQHRYAARTLLSYRPSGS